MIWPGLSFDVRPWHYFSGSRRRTSIPGKTVINRIIRNTFGFSPIAPACFNLSKSSSPFNPYLLWALAYFQALTGLLLIYHLPTSPESLKLVCHLFNLTGPLVVNLPPAQPYLTLCCCLPTSSDSMLLICHLSTSPDTLLLICHLLYLDSLVFCWFVTCLTSPDSLLLICHLLNLSRIIQMQLQ